MLTSVERAKSAPFDVLSGISELVNKMATHNEGRDLAIRALAVAKAFSGSYEHLLVALVRNVGLFGCCVWSAQRAILIISVGFGTFPSLD
jgi:hypothetical protein